MTLKDFAQGENIIKYGYPIGHAVTADGTRTLDANENQIKTNLAGLLDYTYNPVSVNLNIPKDLTFKGYRRKNGDVGIPVTRYGLSLPWVNFIGQLAEALRHETNCEGVDAIVAFPHNYGCSQLGDDHGRIPRKFSATWFCIPMQEPYWLSVWAARTTSRMFPRVSGRLRHRPRKVHSNPESGDEFEEGMKILRELYTKAKTDVREDVPFVRLRVGLKCGGSDGFSGITANPLLGMFSDFLDCTGRYFPYWRRVPKMFGAETILMNRCHF